jgi:glycosyltransferase involved in cell wall biosynthesis
VPYPTGSPRLSQFVIRQIDVFTACSRDMKNYLEGFIAAPINAAIIVTGNGVDASEFENVEPYSHPRPYLLTVGRLIEKKGVDVAIRAMKNLVDAGLDIDLMIAGSGPLDAALRQLAFELGVKARVIFWGDANRRDLAALMNGCALFVLPSIWEAFGIASLEAMVCGKAVVASRCGGIPEIVRDSETGCLVPPGDVNALSRAIFELQSDPARRDACGRHGREIARNEFNWQVVTERYLQAYALAMDN